MFWTADPPHWPAEGSLWLIQVAQMGPALGSQAPDHSCFCWVRCGNISWRCQMLKSRTQFTADQLSQKLPDSSPSFSAVFIIQNDLLATEDEEHLVHLQEYDIRKRRRDDAKPQWVKPVSFMLMPASCCSSSGVRKNLSYVDLLRSRLFITADCLLVPTDLDLKKTTPHTFRQDL